jgi:hypothetical protein
LRDRFDLLVLPAELSGATIHLPALRAFVHPTLASSANGAFGRHGSSLFRGQIAVLGHTLGKLIRLWLRSRRLSFVVDLQEIRLVLPFVTTICLVDIKQGRDYWAAVRPRPNNLPLCGARGNGGTTAKNQDSPDHGRNFVPKK